MIREFVTLVAQLVKNLPVMRETWIWSLGWEDPLEKGKVPIPVFWPGEFHGLNSPWGRKESDMTEQLSLSFFPVELIRSQWVGRGIWHWPCRLSVHKWELSLFSAIRRQWQSHGSVSSALGTIWKTPVLSYFISFLLGKNPGWKPENPTFCTLSRSP